MTLQSRNSNTLAIALRERRQRLVERLGFPVVLWSGSSSPRNFPANAYPFRASSHFLYFAGLPLKNAAIRLEAGRMTLFIDPVPADSALWHGPTPPPAEIAQHIGADEVLPLHALHSEVKNAATIAVQDAATRLQQSHCLGRTVASARAPQGLDLALTQALIPLRLSHDEAALAELRQAAAVTVEAHRAGMQATAQAEREAEVRAAMEGVILAHDMTCAYASIVTVHGEVLHNEQYHHPLRPGELVLADVGAETEGGWAADVTRTWPVAGAFSPTQRDIYQIVLAAHDACIEQVQPEVEYRDIHFLAATVIAEGLVELGILRGRPEDLVAQDAHALFFPHGVGHLLGLDIHDMEDLGDLAGYAPERRRSDRFGLCFLRLDRPLQAGMLVTIEPGFYQVPGILTDPEWRSRYKEAVNWDRLAQFSDVRGIRIEDDVLVTATGHEVLTAALTAQPDEIEALVR